MNKKEIKRREEKEEKNKKKRPKNYIKKEKPKKIRVYGRIGTPKKKVPEFTVSSRDVTNQTLPWQE
jgi:hypothetical protein